MKKNTNQAEKVISLFSSVIFNTLTFFLEEIKSIMGLKINFSTILLISRAPY